MKGTSKGIMGATLVMVVSLAMVLGLILVLLAELYCSLLTRRRQLKIRTTNAATASAAAGHTAEAETVASSSSHPQDQSPDPTPTTPLSSFHAQGVLQAPRSLLFPAISFKEDCLQTKKQRSQRHHQVIDLPKQEQNTNPCHVGIVSTPSPSISFAPSPQPPAGEEKIGGGNGPASTTCNEKTCGCGGGGGSGGKEHFVHFSNPIYENTESRLSGENTPFETPVTSPSRLEMGGSGSSSSSSGEDEIAQPSPDRDRPSSLLTPPLTPTKKLPAEACSVSLRDARSLGTAGSDSNSKNGLSSSSSGSPCTSPSCNGGSLRILRKECNFFHCMRWPWPMARPSKARPV